MAVPAALDTVIVSYCCEGLLRDCLHSLREHPPSRPMTVHVVDNASGDGTAEMAAREFPEVELTVADRNLGFGAANNVGIREGHGTYVLMLNPDTRMTSGALDRLLERMDSRPEVGLCGPRLVREDGTLDHACRRSFPTPLSALGHFTGLGRRKRAKGALAAYRAPDVDSGPVDAVNGAFMLARRSALEEVGLFDEGYWMYMEDLDLCYRLKQAGWTTRYEPSVTVIHIKAGTSGNHRSLRLNCAFHYGMFRFFRAHQARQHPASLRVLVYIGIVAKLVLSVTTSSVWRLAGRLTARLPRRREEERTVGGTSTLASSGGASERGE